MMLPSTCFTRPGPLSRSKVQGSDDGIRAGDRAPNSYEAHYLYARASFAQRDLERAASLFQRHVLAKAIIAIPLYCSLLPLFLVHETRGQGLSRFCVSGNRLEPGAAAAQLKLRQQLRSS